MRATQLTVAFRWNVYVVALGNVGDVKQTFPDPPNILPLGVAIVYTRYPGTASGAGRSDVRLHGKG